MEDRRIIEISALKGEGITDLEDAIVEMVFGGEVSIGETGLVSNIRHKNLLEKALNSIEITLDTIQGDLPLELISVDLKDCWEYLGQITGDTLTEDIVDQIFTNFCIGK